MAVFRGETGVWRYKNGVKIFIRDKLTSTEKDFKHKASSVYYRSKDLLDRDDTSLKDIDWDNPEDVEDMAVALANKLGFKRPACFTIAGIIAAVFEHKNIPYEFHMGTCIPSKRLERMFREIKESNHVWIKNTKNDKIYEHFPGHRIENLYGHTSLHMVRLAKQEKAVNYTFKKGAK